MAFIVLSLALPFCSVNMYMDVNSARYSALNKFAMKCGLCLPVRLFILINFLFHPICVCVGIKNCNAIEICHWEWQTDHKKNVTHESIRKLQLILLAWMGWENKYLKIFSTHTLAHVWLSAWTASLLCTLCIWILQLTFKGICFSINKVLG